MPAPTPHTTDLLLEAFETLIGEIVERVSQKTDLSPPDPHRSSREDGTGIPEREWLTQREAAAWTGISVSGLRRARANGLPSSKALGQVVYAIDDLRDLMAGKYNG